MRSGGAYNIRRIDLWETVTMTLFALFILILAFALPGADWVKGLVIVIAGLLLVVVAVQAIRFAANPDMSPAVWAIRFAASFFEFCRGFCGLILLLKDTYF